MEKQELSMMNIASNLLSAYYGNKAGFCIVNQRDPTDSEKNDLLKRCIPMFGNLSTSYLDDIRIIAENIK
ncbi:MAG: hypothetical protein K9L30_17825 [Desulfobacterales bacterium]|nr:hypothetical protein [Desulfobacterales bacterium]